MSGLEGRRIFITGHTGFKGAWSVGLFRALGAHVAGYALEPPTTPSLFEEAGLEAAVDHTIGDVRDRERLEHAVRGAKPDCILHMAAQSLVLEGLKDPAGTFDTNVTGTANLLTAAAATPSVRAVLVVTSDKCYEPAERPLREEDPLGGHDPYSASKAAAEMVVAGYRAVLKDGPIVATARAGNVIGGGDWAAHRLFADLARAMQGDGTIALRHPAAIRPWQHVLDALRGYVAVIARALAGDRSVGRAWNFGPELSDHLTVSDAVELFAQAYGRPVAVEREPSPQPENPTLMLDSAAALRELGWRPAFDLRAAVKHTAEFYRRRAQGEPVAGLLGEQVRQIVETAAGG